MTPVYWGLFLDEPIVAEPLEHVVRDQHVTFGFRRPMPDGAVRLLGTEWDVTAIGYANDGVNEGIAVELPDGLRRFYDGAGTPHVTLSVSRDGRPRDTASLGFAGVEPYGIACRLGFFDGRTVRYS